MTDVIEAGEARPAAGRGRRRGIRLAVLVVLVLAAVAGLGHWLGYLGSSPIEAGPPEGDEVGTTQVTPGQRLVFGTAFRNASRGVISDIRVRLPATVDGGSRLVDVFVVNPGNPLTPGVVGWPEFEQKAVPAGAHRLTEDDTLGPGQEAMLGLVIEVGSSAADPTHSLYQERFAGVVVDYRFRGMPHQVMAGPAITLCNGTFDACDEERP